MNPESKSMGLDKLAFERWVEMVRSLPQACGGDWYRVLPPPGGKPFVLLANALDEHGIDIVEDLSHSAIRWYLVRRVCQHDDPAASRPRRRHSRVAYLPDFVVDHAHDRERNTNMTSAAFGVVPVRDGDPGWQEFEGAVRVRTVAGVVQLQISTDNGDGSWDIATVTLQGELRDVRKGSLTEWPSYTSEGLPSNFITDTERLASQELRARSGGGVVTRGPMLPPVSGGSQGQ